MKENKYVLNAPVGNGLKGLVEDIKKTKQALQQIGYYNAETDGG